MSFSRLADLARSNLGLTPMTTFASGGTKASKSALGRRKPGQRNAPTPHKTQLSSAPPPPTTPNPITTIIQLLDFLFAFSLIGRSSSSSGPRRRVLFGGPSSSSSRDPWLRGFSSGSPSSCFLDDDLAN